MAETLPPVKAIIPPIKAITPKDGLAPIKAISRADSEGRNALPGRGAGGSLKGTFHRSTERGLKQTGGLFGQLMKSVGDATGFASVVDVGDNLIRGAFIEGMANPAKIESLSEVDSVGDAWEFLVQNAGEQVPNIVLSLGPGGLGALAGKAMITRATLNNIAKGLSVRGFSRSAIKGIGDKYLQTAGAKKVAALGMKRGTLAGVWAGFTPINTGELLQEQRDRYEEDNADREALAKVPIKDRSSHTTALTQEEADTLSLKEQYDLVERRRRAPIEKPDLGVNLLLGAGSSVFEAIGFGVVGKTLFGGASKEAAEHMIRTILRRVGHTTVIGLAAEGGTEAVQEVMVMASRKLNDPTFPVGDYIKSSEGLSRIAFAFASGASVGGVFGAGGGVVSGARNAARAGAIRARLNSRIDAATAAAKEASPSGSESEAKSLFDVKLASEPTRKMIQKAGKAVGAAFEAGKLKLGIGTTEAATTAAKQSYQEVVTELEKEGKILSDVDKQLVESRIKFDLTIGELNAAIDQVIQTPTERSAAQKATLAKTSHEVTILITELNKLSVDKRAARASELLTMARKLAGKAIVDSGSVAKNHITRLIKAAQKMVTDGHANTYKESAQYRKNLVKWEKQAAASIRRLLVKRGELTAEQAKGLTPKELSETMVPPASNPANARDPEEEYFGGGAEIDAQNSRDTGAVPQELDTQLELQLPTPGSETVASAYQVLSGKRDFGFAVGKTIATLPAEVRELVESGQLDAVETKKEVIFNLPGAFVSEQDAKARSFNVDSAEVDPNDAYVVETPAGNEVTNQENLADVVEKAKARGDEPTVVSPQEAVTNVVEKLNEEARQSLEHRLLNITETEMVAQVYRAIKAWTEKSARNNVTNIPAELVVIKPGREAAELGSMGFPITWGEFRDAYSDAQYLADTMLSMENKFADPEVFLENATEETATDVSDLENFIEQMLLDPSELFNQGIRSQEVEASTTYYGVTYKSNRLVPVDIITREDGTRIVKAGKNIKLGTPSKALRNRINQWAKTGKKPALPATHQEAFTDAAFAVFETIDGVPLIRTVYKSEIDQARIIKQVRYAKSRGNKARFSELPFLEDGETRMNAKEAIRQGIGGAFVAKATNREGKTQWLHLGEITALGTMMYPQRAEGNIGFTLKDFWEGVNTLQGDFGITLEFNAQAPENRSKVIVTKAVDFAAPVFRTLPSQEKGVKTYTYAGVGSRDTPDAIQEKMTEVASILSKEEKYTLLTGDATGADAAFIYGSDGKREIFTAKDATDKTRKIAREIHPAPERLKGRALDLMARNTFQIFGKNLDTPVDFVLAWTRDGAETAAQTVSAKSDSGGTGQAIRMASLKGIPVINMYHPGWQTKLRKVMQEQRESQKAAAAKPKSKQPTPKTTSDKLIAGEREHSFTTTNAAINNREFAAALENKAITGRITYRNAVLAATKELPWGSDRDPAKAEDREEELAKDQTKERFVGYIPEETGLEGEDPKRVTVSLPETDRSFSLDSVLSDTHAKTIGDSTLDREIKDPTTNQLTKRESEPQVVNALTNKTGKPWKRGQIAIDWLVNKFNLKDKIVAIDEDSIQARINGYQNQKYNSKNQEETDALSHYINELERAQRENKAGRTIMPLDSSPKELRVIHIFVRKDQSTKRGFIHSRTFILAHEFGHVVQHVYLSQLAPATRQKLLEALAPYDHSQGDKKGTEGFANWMAAYAANELWKEGNPPKRSGVKTTDDPILQKRRFELAQTAAELEAPHQKALLNIFKSMTHSLHEIWKQLKVWSSKDGFAYPQEFADFVAGFNSHQRYTGRRRKTAAGSVPSTPRTVSEGLTTPLGKAVFAQLQLADAGPFLPTRLYNMDKKTGELLEPVRYGQYDNSAPTAKVSQKQMQRQLKLNKKRIEKLEAAIKKNKESKGTLLDRKRKLKTRDELEIKNAEIVDELNRIGKSPVDASALAVATKALKNTILAPFKVARRDVGKPLPQESTEGICDGTCGIVTGRLKEDGLTYGKADITAKSPIGDWNIGHVVALTRINGETYIVNQPQGEFMGSDFNIDNVWEDIFDPWRDIIKTSVPGGMRDHHAAAGINVWEMLKGKENIIDTEFGPQDVNQVENIQTYTENGETWKEANFIADKKAKIRWNEDTDAIEFRSSKAPTVFTNENFTPRLIKVDAETIAKTYSVDIKTAKENVAAINKVKLESGKDIVTETSEYHTYDPLDFDEAATAEVRAKDEVFGSYVDYFKNWAATLKASPKEAVKMLVYTADGELRNMGRVGLWIAQEFHALPSSIEKSLTVFREIHQEAAPHFSKLTRIMNRLPISRIGLWESIRNKRPSAEHKALKAQRDAITEALLLETPLRELSTDVALHVREIREYLNGLYEWYTRDMGLPLRERKNYYPMMLDTMAIEKDRAGYIAILMSHGFTEAQAQNQRMKVTRDEDGGLNNGFQEETNTDEGFLGPGATYKLRRADITLWTPALRADLVKGGFYQHDIATTLTAYTEMMVRRAVWEKRYHDPNRTTYDSEGKPVSRSTPAQRAAYEDRGLNINHPIATLQMKLAKALEDGDINQWQFDRISNDILPAYAGQLGLKTNSHIRKLSAGIIIYQNIRLLGAAVLSSFVDVGTLLARGGNWQDASNATKALLDKTTRAQAYEMLEAIGAMRQGLTEHILNDQALNTFMTGNAKRINDLFFKYNQMEGWTNMMRAMALVSGREFMQRNAKKAREGDATAQRYLNELDITVSEITAWDGHSTSNKRINAALNRYIDESMIRPDASIRPVWMSDPGYAVFSHLKGFLYGFQETFLRRVGREAKIHQNLLPLLTLGMLALPFAVLGYELRRKLTGSENSPEGFAYFKEVVERSGMPGAFQLVVDAEQADEFGKPWAIGLGGPAVEQIYDFLNKDMASVIPKAIPVVAQSPVLQEYVRNTLRGDDR